MSQESPEQQIPLALSPTALAQRDANTMPTEYPKSIGKKTLDARYARDARRLPETPTHWISAATMHTFHDSHSTPTSPLKLT